MNRGEWSEFYAFLRLLGEGSLNAADEELNALPEDSYRLVNILRKLEDRTQPTAFEIIPDLGLVRFTVAPGDLREVSQAKFMEQAELLFQKIIMSDGSFEAPELEPFRAQLGNPKVKEDSKAKKDITLTAFDLVSGRNEELGFSIKSKLGGSSSLFNASQGTNFVYALKSVNPLTTLEVEELNLLPVRKLVKALLSRGVDLHFTEQSSETFTENLTIIDLGMPRLMAELVKQNYASDDSNLAALTKTLIEGDPLGVGRVARRYYTHKVKDFLAGCALGMTAGREWDGTIEANGGYIVVKGDGTLVCYHAYNWDKFKSYLLKYSFLDTASTTRHGFGEIYSLNNALYLKLNLQVRFH